MNEAEVRGYDIIGDVHGCANALEKLLSDMGYKKRQGVYQYPGRQALFVGDIVDRGPHIREALDIIYAMIDGGYAQMVMGNHEYNLYCYCTPDPRTQDSSYLWQRNTRTTRLVAETLAQFAHYPHDFKAYLDWFSTLPVYLDFPDFRVVHACWDDDYILNYQQTFKQNTVTPEIIVASTEKGSLANRVLDRLLCGTRLPLPDNQSFRSRDGFERRIFRTKFWAEAPKTYSDVVYQPDPLPEHLMKRELNPNEHDQLINYPESGKPVFFGHYWLQGRPQPVRHNLCCLDYSAVKYGRLVAYRYDGEPQISPDKYVWVYVDPKEYYPIEQSS